MAIQPRGYGAILRYRQHERTFSEGYRLTTNNRMELMAAIVALEGLKEHCEVVLSTDSQYVRRDHPVDPQLEKTRLENRRKKAREECRSLETSGCCTQPASNSLGGSKVMQVTRKTNAAMNWRETRP